MSSTFSLSTSETFSLLHAKRIASKVATDLQRLQRFYGSPTDAWIAEFESEITQLLKYDVVAEVIYGFKRAGKWTEAALRYKALPGGTLMTDDDPGKIRPGLDISGAAFSSFLTHNSRWNALSQKERQAVQDTLPFERGTCDTPALETGYWHDDLNYFAGGRGLGRSTVRR